MAGGRPTKYRAEYPERLVQHMQAGLSYESFAASCDVAIDTLYEWEKVHKEFSDAKKRGIAKSLAWWEKAGIMGMLSGSKEEKFNATVWIYTMKCRFPKYWAEKQEVAHVIKDQRQVQAISDDDMNQFLLQASDDKVHS